MKLYLSSFKFGNKKDQLRGLAPRDSILIIPNALDFRPSSDEQTVNSLDNKNQATRIGLRTSGRRFAGIFWRSREALAAG